MLAGLIFATEAADDRADTLAATLPFGGLTLIEFQARLLIAAGAAQIVIVVARMTPELLGAISRISRRAASVDTVRSAAEALEKFHPLAFVLVVGDGLVTSAEIVASMAAQPRDALLVTDSADVPPGFARLGASTAWAGLARLSLSRIAEVAALPSDYDFESTLLRVAAQGGVEHLVLPEGVARGGHGVERDSRALASRSNAILAALVSARPAWIDGFVLAPIARLALPHLLARSVSTLALTATAAVLAVAVLAAIGAGWIASGLVVALLVAVVVTIGGALAWLREEPRHEGVQQGMMFAMLALAAPLVARGAALAAGGAVDWATPVALIVAAALVERAAAADLRRRWWASPAAYPVVVLPFAVAGWPVVGLAAAGLYAAATLAAVIETLRKKP